MDVKARLEETKRKLEDIVKKIATLDQAKEKLLQEALRLDGERRLLVEIEADKAPQETKKGGD